MSTSKGRDFERQVHDALLRIEARFPECVKVTAQSAFSTAVSGRPHRADFEFEYKLGGLTHQHLIECQNRNRSSHEIADKIYAVRGTSDRNRYILVYKDAEYLSPPVQERLTRMGVLHFTFKAFKRDFLDQLEADLALRRIGLLVYRWPVRLLQKLMELFRSNDDAGGLNSNTARHAPWEPFGNNVLRLDAKVPKAENASLEARPPQVVKLNPAAAKILPLALKPPEVKVDLVQAKSDLTFDLPEIMKWDPPKVEIPPSILKLFEAKSNLGELSALLESATKYSPSRPNPPDRAMISGR